jgi:hypothetical protein
MSKVMELGISGIHNEIMKLFVLLCYAFNPFKLPHKGGFLNEWYNSNSTLVIIVEVDHEISSNAIAEVVKPWFEKTRKLSTFPP